MYQQQKASSIIEAMVVLIIIVTGIVWVYGLMNSSQKLASSTGNKIEAIQIARDGLESMTNIRDTNWILFWADRKNCWNTENYDVSCIGNSSTTSDINHLTTQGIYIWRDINNRFIIWVENHSWADSFSNPTYRSRFTVYKDLNGFYTQNTGSWFTPLYTREMRVRYLTPSGTVWTSNEDRMEITAIVQWQDQWNTQTKRLEMSTLLTNWKE
jgi:hypothetical protein